MSLLLLVSSAVVLGQEPLAEAEPALFTVRVPADARLFIENSPTLQTGAVRTFTTPPLEPGYRYSYSLRAEIVRDGKLVRRSKTIYVQPGRKVTVDFGAMSGASAANAPGLSGAEKLLLDLTNKQRAKEGLDPLRANADLARAARAHSANMARQGKLAHVLDDIRPEQRIRKTGYQAINWGENIAFGMPTPAEAVEVWMGSEGHRRNILNPDFTEIGIGIVNDERGIPFYTQVFATPFGR